MTDEEILDLIREAHTYASPDRPEVRSLITSDASLSDLGIDSVAAMEMAGFIEERLDVDFPDDDMAALGSMSELIELIKKFGRKAGAGEHHAL